MQYKLAACLLLLSLNSYAALNKWVDAEGKIHYSDSAPSDVKVEKLRTTTTPNSGGSQDSLTSEPKSLAERDAEWKKAQKAKEEAASKQAKESEAAQAKQKNCESARSNLSTYQNSPRLATYDANGERKILDDAERAKGLDEANKAVSTFCN